MFREAGDFSGYKVYQFKHHEQVYNVLVADDFLKIARGLSKINDIPEGFAGMYFVFKHYTKQPFTTKGMKFNIDIMFLDENNNILEKFDNLKPGIRIIKPKNKYKFVLETKPSLII